MPPAPGRALEIDALVKAGIGATIEQKLKGWKPENYSREYFGPVSLQQVGANGVAEALTLSPWAVNAGGRAAPRSRPPWTAQPH